MYQWDLYTKLGNAQHRLDRPGRHLLQDLQLPARTRPSPSRGWYQLKAIPLQPLAQQHRAQLLEVLQHAESWTLSTVSRSEACLFCSSSYASTYLVEHKPQDAVVVSGVATFSYTAGSTSTTTLAASTARTVEEVFRLVTGVSLVAEERMGATVDLTGVGVKIFDTDDSCDDHDIDMATQVIKQSLTGEMTRNAFKAS